MNISKNGKGRSNWERVVKRGRLYSQPADAVEFLKDEYASRCRKNPRYSMRAFAKMLNVHSGTLSKILSGKRGLSVSMAENMAECLKLNARRREWFVGTVQLKTARSKVAREVAKRRLSNLRVKPLSSDVFRSIADWKDFATLAVASLPNVQMNSETLVKVFSLSPSEASALIDRLIRLNLLDATTLKPIHLGDHSWGLDGFGSEASLNYHRGFLGEAVKVVRDSRSEMRDLASGILAIRRSRFDDLRSEVKDFFKHVFEKYSTSDNGDAVIGIGVQCFEIVRPEELA